MNMTATDTILSFLRLLRDATEMVKRQVPLMLDDIIKLTGTMESMSEMEPSRFDLTSLQLKSECAGGGLFDELSAKVVEESSAFITDYAYSGSLCRGGNHGDIFHDDEAYTIKHVMKKMSEAAKAPLQIIGFWLVWIANTVGKFSDRELHRAEREVKDIADGRYDWRIERFENRN